MNGKKNYISIKRIKMMDAKPFLIGILLFLSIINYIRGSSIIIVCENELAYLRCPDPETINILSANYGRTENSTICPADPEFLTDLNCQTANTMKIAMLMCNGRTKCTLKATNDVFGDPCLGTYKYLYLEFVCEDNTVG